jgi:hypothetical protein
LNKLLPQFTGGRSCRIVTRYDDDVKGAHKMTACSAKPLAYCALDGISAARSFIDFCGDRYAYSACVTPALSNYEQKGGGVHFALFPL